MSCFSASRWPPECWPYKCEFSVRNIHTSVDNCFSLFKGFVRRNSRLYASTSIRKCRCINCLATNSHALTYCNHNLNQGVLSNSQKNVWVIVRVHHFFHTKVLIEPGNAGELLRKIYFFLRRETLRPYSAFSGRPSNFGIQRGRNTWPLERTAIKIYRFINILTHYVA